MWIVTVMESYYPSIFEFDNYDDARKKYDELVKEAQEEHNAGDEEFKVHISSVLESGGAFFDDKVDWT